MGNDIDTADIIRRGTDKIFRGNPPINTKLPSFVELYDEVFGPRPAPQKSSADKINRKHLHVVK